MNSDFFDEHDFYSEKKVIIKEDLDYNILMSIAYRRISRNKIQSDFYNTRFLVSDIKDVFIKYFIDKIQPKFI